MKKLWLPCLTLVTLVVTSCGGKKASKDDLLNDLNEMCKCYRAGKDDSKKFMECTGKNEENRKKYKGDMLVKYDDDLATCIAQ